MSDITAKSKYMDIQEARKIALERHPNGFNRAQLTKIYKEYTDNKYGKFNVFNTDYYAKIETDEDINHKRSSMIRGNYPASISDCEVVGKMVIAVGNVLYISAEIVKRLMKWKKIMD